MQSFANFITEAFNEIGTGPFWSSLLNTAILAAIFEEWLYRGIVLRGLLTKMSPAWAIVISALFFAFVHMNPWQGLNCFLLGLLMGYVYYKTGSLLLTMLMHLVNNGAATIIELFPALNEADYFGDIIPLPLYAVLFILAVVVLVACLMAIRRIQLEQKRGNIDEVAPRNQTEP